MTDTVKFHFGVDLILGGTVQVTTELIAKSETKKCLCSACNLAIGKFQDNPDLLEAAAKYLRGNDG